MDLSLPDRLMQAVIASRFARKPQDTLEAVGPDLNREPNLDNRPRDLHLSGEIGFEHMAQLFASTSFDHAISSMTIGQGAYLFGLIRQMTARKIVEIGRYKGGITLIMAAALGNKGKLWSIDLGYKES